MEESPGRAHHGAHPIEGWSIQGAASHLQRMKTPDLGTTSDVADQSGNVETQTQTPSGGARQEIRLQDLRGSRSERETTAAATLGRSREGRVSSDE